MKTVGNRLLPEFILDPAEALRRGCALDAMLRDTTAPHPRGVFRGTHAWFNAMDEARMLAAARRVVQAPRAFAD